MNLDMQSNMRGNWISPCPPEDTLIRQLKYLSLSNYSFNRLSPNFELFSLKLCALLKSLSINTTQNTLNKIMIYKINNLIYFSSVTRLIGVICTINEEKTER